MEVWGDARGQGIGRHPPPMSPARHVRVSVRRVALPGMGLSRQDRGYGTRRTLRWPGREGWSPRCEPPQFGPAHPSSRSQRRLRARRRTRVRGVVDVAHRGPGRPDRARHRGRQPRRHRLRDGPPTEGAWRDGRHRVDHPTHPRPCQRAGRHRLRGRSHGRGRGGRARRRDRRPARHGRHPGQQRRPRLQGQPGGVAAGRPAHIRRVARRDRPQPHHRVPGQPRVRRRAWPSTAGAASSTSPRPPARSTRCRPRPGTPPRRPAWSV